MTTTQVSPLFQQKPVEGLRLGLKTMLGRAYPRLMSVMREPDWILYEIILPLQKHLRMRPLRTFEQVLSESSSRKYSQ